MKTAQVDLSKMDDFLSLIEVQRELVYHLMKYKEAVSERLKEFEIIKNKAQIVQNLRAKFREIYPELKKTLTEEQAKAINNLLQKRHIKL